MNKGYTSKKKISALNHATLQPIGTGRIGSDVLPKALYKLNALGFTVGTGGTSSVEIAASGAKVGDVIRLTSGVNDGAEVTVIEVTGDTLKLGHSFDVEIAAGDTCDILRPITLSISKEGELSTSSGPIKFIKDSVEQLVIKDSVDFNNTVGMPVEIVGTNGAEINITAGDIGVQLTHAGANPDSTRIGDGTNELGVNSDNEALTHDTTAHLKLDTSNLNLASIDTKMDSLATEGTLATRASETTLATRATELTAAAILAKLVAAPALESKQDTLIAEIQALRALNAKEVQQSVFNASQALTTASTVFIGSIIPATENIREIEVAYKDGATLAVYFGATLVGMVTQGGGKIPVNILGDGALQIGLRAVGSDVTVADLMVNIIK